LDKGGGIGLLSMVGSKVEEDLSPSIYNCYNQKNTKEEVHDGLDQASNRGKG